MNSKVYSVTVIDLSDGTDALGFQKTPAIFTTLDLATYAVINNEDNLSDDGTYQYAVIEETTLNVIRPCLCIDSIKMWFRYNTVMDEFEPCTAPKQLHRISGFGIG